MAEYETSITDTVALLRYTKVVMFSKIKNNQTLRTIFDTRNIGLYALVLVALSVTWSSVKIIEKNYELQKSIASLEQDVAILGQQTKNQKLKNEYYKTDAYLDLAARKYFSKAAPGEKILIVPPEVAATYIKSDPDEALQKPKISQGSKIMKNFRAWSDFIAHREP